MKKSIRFLLLILAALFIYSAALAEPWQDYEYYILVDGSAVITGYSGSEQELIVPSVLNGHRVTSIGEEAFQDCYSLTSVILPDSVTSIGNYAFAGCDSLASFIIPDGVTSVGEAAFSECNSLTSVIIPDSVISIGTGAFYNCSSLTSVIIPDSVTSIGGGVFSSCQNLEKIWISPEHPVFSLIDGVLFNKVTKSLLFYPSNKSEKLYNIPDGITSIAAGAFAYSNLTSVNIPDSVTSIGDAAFTGCSSLTSITIPKSVSSIGKFAFSQCSSLTSVTIPEGVTSIGAYAFDLCSSLTSVTIPNSVTYIGEVPFTGNGQLVLNVGQGYYADRHLYAYNKVYTDASVAQWQDYEYRILEDSTAEIIKYIGSEQELVIPSNVDGYSVTSIGESAFLDCRSLVSVIIPDGVISIGTEAFYTCSSLTSVTIPDSITSIGNWAFAYCDSLEEIIISSDHPVFSLIDNVLFNKTTKSLIYYPSTKSEKSYEIPDGITSIGDWAFCGCSNLSSVIIPKSVTSIGELAFYRCSSLTSVTIQDGVTSIGREAFQDCSKLESITIPYSVTSIGFAAFPKCEQLVLTVGPKSYAEIYAADHKINFVYSGASVEQQQD